MLDHKFLELFGACGQHDSIIIHDLVLYKIWVIFQHFFDLIIINHSQLQVWIYLVNFHESVNGQNMHLVEITQIL